MANNDMDTENTTIDDTLRKRAVDLALMGYRVFPLAPYGKTPTIKNYPEVATNDPAKVKAIWTDAVGEPSNYNIGVATGRGLIAVDYDVKHGKNGLLKRDEFDAKGLPQSARVVTPTGGEHLYLSIPNHVVIGHSAGALGEGVDTRGHNGYVVGPGSILDHSVVPNDTEVTGAYEWLIEQPKDQLDATPDWFFTTLAQRSRLNDNAKHTQPLVDLDDDAAIDRVKDYLVKDAPHAIEGDGGDHRTFAVASRVKDMGVSEDMALSLLLEHWNDSKASPPWSVDELTKKVANAYSYGQNQIGIDNPCADFEVYTSDIGTPPYAAAIASKLEPNPDWPRPTLLRPYDPADLPIREFVFKQNFARKTVSAIVAPSGAGKTQWFAQAALALATGRGDLCGLEPIKPMNVWIWNQEDDRIELQRRIGAAIKCFDVPFEQIEDRLFLDSGVDKRLTLAMKHPQGGIKPSKYVPLIIERALQSNIDAIIIDPLVEFHEGEENDNVQMATVAGILRRIAVETNAAVLIGHHDRKPDSASSDGHVGNQNALRGASAIQGVTRAINTLYTMSKQDAVDNGVDEDKRHLYVRMDGAKTNLSLAGGKPSWFKRTGQPLRYEPTQDVDFDTIIDGVPSIAVEGSEVGVLVPVDAATEFNGSRVEQEKATMYDDIIAAVHKREARFEALTKKSAVGAGLWWPLKEIVEMSDGKDRQWRRAIVMLEEQQYGRAECLGGVLYAKKMGSEHRVRLAARFED